MTAPDLSIGSRIREARRGRSLRWLAGQTGVSPTHLSRVENGERLPSLDLLSTMEAVLDLRPGELAESASGLTDKISNRLGAADLSLAVGRGESLCPAAFDALRRLHLAMVAERFLRGIGGSARLPIDPMRVAAAAHVSVSTSNDASSAPVRMAGRSVVVAGPSGTLHHRFWIAHAVGHALLGNTMCETASGADAELDASAIASFLLVPRTELAREQRALRARQPHLDFWDAADATTLLATLGSRFGAPIWLIARRLGEDGRLAELVEVDER